MTVFAGKIHRGKVKGIKSFNMIISGEDCQDCLTIGTGWKFTGVRYQTCLLVSES